MSPARSAEAASRAAGAAPPRWQGLVAVFATYVQFLLWAQFGFLGLLHQRLSEPNDVRFVMAFMGTAGLVASFTTAAFLGRMAGRRLVVLGLAANAASALLALPAVGFGLLSLAAMLIGASTAVTTVAVAAELGNLLPPRRFGLTVGAGTGLAYFLCNLPPLFTAPPTLQALVVALVCGLAALALGRSNAAPGKVEPLRKGAPLGPWWAGRRGLAGACLALGLLVGLDSAAFAWIQATPSFQQLTWGGGWLKPLLGAVHLLAALAAGALLDRGLVAALLAGAWALFAAAFTLLGLTRGVAEPSFVAGPLYAVGISLYSVVLVVLPASGASARLPARWRAAWIYGLAGWICSALGVGMAQDLGRIPRGALLAAGLGVGAALLWVATARRSSQPGLRLVAAPSLGFLALAVPAALWSFGTSAYRAEARQASALDPGAAVARGREVYLAEGCIHCHSQYVRPEGRDVELWGPFRPLDRHQSPVLIGYRRQGPDLENVGLRRSALWQRLHLEDPRALVPSSRMPSYAHLFRGGDGRGEDLVAYLSSLGRGPEPESASAASGIPLSLGSAVAGHRWFARDCAACHGPDGRGDGPLAEAVRHPALDLGKDRFWFAQGRSEDGSLGASLASIVRHGIPGTPMPGHELLTDAETADLVAYLLTRPGQPAADGLPHPLSETP